jgi:transcription-repair coupling factor (superfamily II helicase)
LKDGKEPDLDGPLNAGIDINLHIPAMLPEDYMPDVHLRLILYKRIASADSREQLKDLQVELIDRFGLLPEATKNLMRIAAIKQDATILGIEKIDASEAGGYIQFGSGAKVDPVALVRLVQEDGETYRLQGAHRLQFRVDLSDTAQRFKFIEELLTLLVAKPDTDAQRAMTG